jgi:hypothetical protein
VKLIFWGVVILGLGYAAYTGMIATWSWIAVHNAVDEVLSKEGIEVVPEREIRARVLGSTGEAGVSINERDIVVTREGDSIRVEVRWTIPVIVLDGKPVLAVPFTVKRASTPTGVTR